MLTKTTQSAIKALLLLTFREDGDPLSHRAIAEHLGASPTYMAKIIRNLVKVDIVTSVPGAHGGVFLSKDPADISLLEVVEASQGNLARNHCTDNANKRYICTFHLAMVELHEAITGVLSKWTIADLARKPKPSRAIEDLVECVMINECPMSKECPW